MTTVHISLVRDDGTDQTPARGVVEWQPTARREDGTDVILPRGFTTPLVAGEASVTVDPSGLTWCWRVTERTDSGGVVRYVSVPDSATTVEYVDLPDVDPTTFDPTVDATAAWWAMAKSTVTTGEVVGDDLILTRTDGTTVNAGDVRGPAGADGADGAAGADGADGTDADTSGQFATHALTAAASVTLSADYPAQSLTMTQNTELVAPTVSDGHAIVFWLSGAFTPTWFTIKWAGGTAPTYAAAGTLYHLVKMGAAGWLGSGQAYS